MSTKIRMIIKNELEKMKQDLFGMTFDQLEEGGWFETYLTQFATAYKGSLPSIEKKVKGERLSPETLADRLIGRAARVVAGVGGAISGTLTESEAALLHSDKSKVGREIPSNVLAMMAEVIYALKLQVALVFDIALLFGAEYYARNPIELLSIFWYALVPEGSSFEDWAFKAISAEELDEDLKKGIREGSLELPETLDSSDLARKIGHRLYQRAILKSTMPKISVPLIKGFLCYYAKAVGKLAKIKMKKKGLIADDVDDYFQGIMAEQKLILPLIMSMAMADGELHESELAVFRKVLDKIAVDPEEKSHLIEEISMSREQIFDELKKLEGEETKELFFQALLLTAVADGALEAPEKKYLEEVAGILGIELDEEDIQDWLKDYGAEIPDAELA
jgi:uncharacterized tellurite resistance protein B-like protein